MMNSCFHNYSMVIDCKHKKKVFQQMVIPIDELWHGSYFESTKKSSDSILQKHRKLYLTIYPIGWYCILSRYVYKRSKLPYQTSEIEWSTHNQNFESFVAWTWHFLHKQHNVMIFLASWPVKFHSTWSSNRFRNWTKLAIRWLINKE